ncbi:hypothetical protein V495_02418 [Pseudogymnoascus sp. VKM F-4514 (FW-929)]|nr:hypothetical protein V495_02418 [Pseudogymnoascus sp. VKM F-4514 (FW-929)]KFY60256.1 hypothetical protein V497_03746 [Pseudogymnoascus sp. VKM F-4516 (FW-969)]
MSEDASGTYSFDRILNFRDVGKTINQYTGKRLVAEGRLFRSARPDDASISDREALQNDVGIKTVMDLRTKSEHVKQAKKREGDLKVPALLKSNDALAQPVQIPGLQYLNININGKGFERTIVWRLSFWNIFKVLILMLFGYRMEAISILGREVMKPRGLIGLGYDTIDYCGVELATALREFASSPRYPILVHCTQGKDRTGMVICLLLFLLDVPIEAVVYDYTLSEAGLLPEREERMVEIREIGLTEEFADAPREWIEKMHEYLGEKYGGVREYLEDIGVDEETQAKIIEALLG